jgi:uncharacterized membrane protein YgcG
MRRVSLTCLALVGLTFASSPALAGGGGWNSFWHRVHTDFYRNNTWPQPFEAADRAATREPFCIQTDNGWKMQNTIGTFLFDSETQRLNTAGELLVKWIVTQAPLHRRAVFVLKGDNAEVTTVRVESVQTAVAKYASGHVCPVLLTDTEPAGWSAAYVDSITQQFNSTIPAPRLSEGGQSGGGGSGGGGGGGGGGQ